MFQIKNEIQESFFSSILENQVTILRGDTGSGKSTNSMIWLVQEGFSIVSAQPRIINTHSLHEYCSRSIDCGFINGDRSTNTSAPGLFVTTGILQAKLLDPTFEPDFVAIDECHEFSQQQELCLALIKKRFESGWKTKLLIVSATLNDDEISSYFDGFTVGNVHMGGVKFPITEKHINNTEIMSVIKSHLIQGHRILMFLSGKPEIAEWEERIKRKQSVSEQCNNPEDEWNFEFKITPAHSEVENITNTIKDHGVPEIILSTDICAAGVTPENLQVVIDLGERKQVEETAGIWGLRPVECSRAELDQRKGRTGRVCPGWYYLASRTPYSERRQYPIPEIQRQNIQKLELDVRTVQQSCNNLSFVHQPNEDQVEQAINILSKWDLLDESGITDLGRQVARLPIDVNLARMLLEAQSLGCTRTVILATSIMAVGRFLNCPVSIVSDVRDCEIGALMQAYKKFINDHEARNSYRESLIKKNLFAIRDRVSKLEQVVKVSLSPDKNPDKYKQALATTMRRFKCTGTNTFGVAFRCPETGVIMNAERGSVVTCEYGDEVLGTPKIIKPRNGAREFTLLTMISKLEKESELTVSV